MEVLVTVGCIVLTLESPFIQNISRGFAGTLHKSVNVLVPAGDVLFPVASWNRFFCSSRNEVYETIIVLYGAGYGSIFIKFPVSRLKIPPLLRGLYRRWLC